MFPFCNPAAADLVIGFSIDNGTSFANSFEITTGESLAVSIYLRQSAPDSVLTDEGIVAWGFDLTSAPMGFGTISDAMPNDAQFDFENHNENTATGFEWEYAETANTGIKGNDVLLGSFQFNTIADGTTSFFVEDRLVGSGVGNASWITPSFAILDEQIFGTGAAGTFQFSVNASAIPEPSSLAMLGCILGLTVSRRRRTPPSANTSVRQK